ncbi:organic hydroperoxide resistance protein [Kangiella sediminilitoris]|uniref:Organic hydroperoxide resistance protein n=1 Tax=Kangiella sediminilitoris TaxID=1144748 RepID=A0A1B3BAV1_9GAMM|nr:organic hydroperoxide resistance protein [Kangiella sediminilitoris]AOE49919.1 Organic hydroperoxide resistance protein [Kangiella sediminilitoris]
MKQPHEIAYTAKATATGGRAGKAKSDDGKLEVKLSTPKELGGSGGDGTNPEQLFAAGYSACFIGAMQHVAAQEKVKLPEDTSITGHVGIGPTDGGFAIDVELHVSVPGMEKSQAKDIVDKAHQVCPYSNATRNGVDVRLKVV